MPKYISNAVMTGDGEPCPRCGQMMRAFAHHEIGKQQRRAPFYFVRWYRSYNIDHGGDARHGSGLEHRR